MPSADYDRLTRLLFNARYYSQQVYCVEATPLEDFRASGYRQLADPHPLFDMRYFVRRHRLTDASGDPFETLAALTARAGRCPPTTPFFNSEWYLAAYPDVVRAGVDPFLHYVENGAREGRRANPWYELAPFADDPEAHVGALAGIDAWIEQADAARIVTTEWIRGFPGLSPPGSHAAFWRARAAGAPMCPINPEDVFGPIAAAEIEALRQALREFRPAEASA